MKKNISKIIMCLLLVCVLLGENLMHVYAEDSGVAIWIETIKEDVPIWSKATQKSKKLKTVKKERSVLEATGITTNEYGNKWYALCDGGYIYAGNVKEHVHKAALCGMESGLNYEIRKKEHVKLETIPSTLCGCKYVMEKATIKETVEEHVYINDYCECGKHEHIGVKCTVFTLKQNIDKKYHYAVETVVGLCSCGEVLEENTKSTKQKHEFEDGICGCGYSTKEKKILDTFNIGLSMCGFAGEPVSTICDVVDIAVSALSGDVEDTLLSVSATLVPFISSSMIKSSDDIVNSINKTYDVVQVDEKTTYWTRTNILDGRTVYTRDDLFDPYYVSTWGKSSNKKRGTNIERMLDGYAPIGYDGRSVELHHMTQRNNSTLAEISSSFHKKNSKVLHINSGTCIPSGIDRNAFDKFRSEYWIQRAQDFIE